MLLHCCLIVIVASQAAAFDVVVFSQPTTSDDASVGLGWYSHSEPRVRKNFKHADDFILGSDAELTRAVWWGQSSYHTLPDLTNFDTFQIEIFEAIADGNLWLPGALIAAEVFDIANTNATPTGRETPAGAFEYRHEVVFSSPIALPADTRFMLAVSAGMIDTGSSADAWQWQDADFNNGLSATYSWAGDTWTGSDDADSGFELFAIPAPATAALLVPSLLALTRRR